MLRPAIRALVASVICLFTTTAAAETTVVDFGPLILSISDSETAQLFHIVDQLSEWDQYAHRQYGRWARSQNFTNEDRARLQQHAALRRARGRGKGFEQAFQVDDSIDGAAAAAVRNQLLTAAEVADEARILHHFETKLRALIEQQRAQLAQFRARLVTERAALTPTIASLARFAESQDAVRVPVFLIANPEEANGGGGANGGRLVVEVPFADAMAFLLHESLHFLLVPHQELIRQTAAAAGLTWQMLNEGLAYALAPGIISDRRESDPLAEALARYLLRGTPASDAYVQSNSMAAVIRPVLQASLDRGETITTFLPKAVAKWQTIVPQTPKP
jgi:hypothetical protein